MSPNRASELATSTSERQIVLILSCNAVIAALLGALVETLGFAVRFLAPSETPDEALRREKPAVLLVDSDDESVLTDETLGRAAMRRIPVVLFGSAEALGRVRQLALDHALLTLTMPTSPETLGQTLRQATSDYSLA